MKMRNINSYKLFSNNNEKSKKIREIVDNKLKENGFISKDDDYDLGIAIGGDGSFLRMVKNAPLSVKSMNQATEPLKKAS